MLLKNFWCGKMSLRRCVAVAAVSSLLVLAACGGDSGISAPSDDGASDSEEIQSSSSSQKRSSPSNISSSSSSLKTVSSSSSEKAKSSSSSKGEAKSSSSNQSSSSNGKNGDGWSWDVPKEARLNPEIAYDSMTDSRDGQIYKTVKIASQVWMAENLNYADSVKIPSLKGKSWCYDNKAKNCAVAGRLYTWAAAIDSVKLATDADNPQNCGYVKTCTLPAKVQGICPDGWHLPTKTEWETLITAVGGHSTAGKILKYQTGWISNGNDTDGVGFSALPAGRMDGNGYSCYDGDYAGFWSATEYDGGFAYGLELLYYSDGGVPSSDEIAQLAGNNYKGYGFSVRCLKD